MLITGFEISSWTLLHLQLLVIAYLEILRGPEGVRGQLNYMYLFQFSLCPFFHHPQIELHILEECVEEVEMDLLKKQVFFIFGRVWEMNNTLTVPRPHHVRPDVIICLKSLQDTHVFRLSNAKRSYGENKSILLKISSIVPVFPCFSIRNQETFLNIVWKHVILFSSTTSLCQDV